MQTRLEEFSDELLGLDGFEPLLPKDMFRDHKALRKKIRVEFYPYKGITNTIRDKDGLYLIRLSDMLQDAPRDVLDSLCWLLIYRIRNRTVPPGLDAPYKKYVHSDEIDRRVSERRKSSGRKLMDPPRGKAYDLEEMFDKINLEYFDSLLLRPQIGFSVKRTRTRWGHFDPDLKTITISRTLDSLEVPRFVVEYIMYHEMLHMVHKLKKSGGKRNYHYKEFRADERKFKRYKKAVKWLGSLATALRNKRRKR